MRNIVGSLSKIDGTPAVNTKIKFVLVDANDKPISSFDIGGERVYGQKTVTTDENGDFTIALWENDKFVDVTYYYVTVAMSAGTPFKAALLTGTGDISWLDFKLSGEPVTPAELDVLQAYFDTIYAPIGSGGGSTPEIGDILITYATAPTGYILVEDSGVDEVLYPELASILPIGMVSNILDIPFGWYSGWYSGGQIYQITGQDLLVYNTNKVLIDTITIPAQYNEVSQVLNVEDIIYINNRGVFASYANYIWAELPQTGSLNSLNLKKYKNRLFAYGVNLGDFFEWNGTSWDIIPMPSTLESIQDIYCSDVGLYVRDYMRAFFSSDLASWEPISLPTNRCNIGTFYPTESGALCIASSDLPLVYLSSNNGTNWEEKYITSSNSVIGQIVASDDNYFMTSVLMDGTPIISYTSDFTIYQSLNWVEQIISFEGDALFVYYSNIDKAGIVSLKPLANNIAPNHTYVYAGN